MNRRSFLTGLGTGLVAPQFLQIAAAQVPGAGVIPERDYEAMGIDADPRGGHPLKPEKQVLFTDYRHIEIGDLAWFSPEGEALPVAGPPGDPVPAHARTGMTPHGIRLQAMKPKMEGPLEKGPPGEVRYDEGTYRVWNMETHYPAGANLGSYSVRKPDSISITYHESPDGEKWEQKGSSTIKVSEGTGFDGQYFFRDPHGKPEERFKGLFHAGLTPDSPLIAELWKQYARLHPIYRHPIISSKRVNVLFGLTSPDGVNWKLVEKPLMIHYGDTRSTVYYDEWLGKYVLYTRQYWFRRRMVARAVSDDFYNWSPAEPLLWPELSDPLSYDIYTNSRTSYPGLPSYHLMFPMFYRRYDQTSEIHMYSSVNGKMWHRLPGGPIIEAGDLNGATVEYANVSGDLLPKGDRVGLWYGGNAMPHKYPRWPNVDKSASGWAWWQQGRLGAVVAEEEGEFFTFEMPMQGHQLRLNARIRRAGEIRVGLARKGGAGPLEDVVVEEEGFGADQCDPISGDSSSHVVTWKGRADIASKRSSFNLRFKMRRAELFGFAWV